VVVLAAGRDNAHFLLAAAGLDRIVRVYDIVDGKVGLLFAIRQQDAAIRAVAFSPDSRRLAVAGANGQIQVWDVAARGDKPPLTMTQGYSISALAYSRDGRYLASGAQNGSITLWTPTGQPARTYSHPGEVRCLAFGRHDVLGTILASGSTGDRSLKVWRVDTNETREWGEYSGHGNFVLTLSFSPDGKRLASGSQDGSVRLWDVITRQDVLKLSFKPSVPTSLTFSSDGQRLAVTHFAGVSIFNGSAGNQPLPQ
jgi:WD40 repeat protein